MVLVQVSQFGVHSSYSSQENLLMGIQTPTQAKYHNTGFYCFNYRVSEVDPFEACLKKTFCERYVVKK